MWYSLFKVLIFVPLVRGLFRATITGEGNIPATGGVMLASNHLGAGDTFMLPTLIERHVTFPAKAELFAPGKNVGRMIVAWFLRLMHEVPLDRSGGRSSLEAFRPILAELAKGGVVGIYPEGKRSPDGRLYKGKTGVARMALAADVPVVPIAMFDSQTVRNRLGIPWIRRPRIVVGTPLAFHEYRAQADDHQVLRYVTDEIMNAIQELSGQTYVDVYAASVVAGRVSAQEADKRILPRPGYGATPPAITA